MRTDSSCSFLTTLSTVLRANVSGVVEHAVDPLGEEAEANDCVELLCP